MNDDHERMTCTKAGTIGHWSCGVCPEHECPRFECGCILRMAGEVDGLGRSTPGRVSLALIFDDRVITVGPRDAATRQWLEELGGSLHVTAALSELSKRWLNAGISRRDLPILAAELKRLIADRYGEHAERHNHGHSGRGWYHAPLDVEVRACEYVAPPPTYLELQEIR